MAAVVLAVLGGFLASMIMAEYEFEGFTPWMAALAVGVLTGEVVAGLGKWLGPQAMVVTGAVAAGSMLYGEWLESDAGVEPWSHLAWGAAALAAAVAAWTVRPKKIRSSRSAGS
jgi:hypothetical protein